MMIGLQKSQEMENQISPGYLNGFQNVDARNGHQYHRRTGTLDKVEEMVLQEEEEEEEEKKTEDFKTHYWQYSAR